MVLAEMNKIETMLWEERKRTMFAARERKSKREHKHEKEEKERR